MENEAGFRAFLEGFEMDMLNRFLYLGTEEDARLLGQRLRETVNKYEALKEQLKEGLDK